MFELFEYAFMREAFIIGFCIALILPCMGLIVVLKRLSMIGDTLSHASLTGLTIGLVFGFNPILSAIVACAFAGLGVDLISQKLKKYQEISTVIILAASIGLAGLFSSYVSNSNAISSYLFGSILTISTEEFYLILGMTVFILVVYRKLYYVLYLSVFDLNAAHILGINIKLLNFTVTFLSAVAISVSAKTIGSLIVSSLLVLPIICAMQIAKTYKGTLIIGILFSVLFVFSGLTLSYFYNLRPGAVIVLIAVLTLLLLLFIKPKKG